jgi:hypothetical protein
MLATRLITAFLLFTSGVVAAALSTAGHTHARERLLQRPVTREEVGKPTGQAAPEGESPRLYMVTVGGKTGFIDRTGKLVIAPKFDLVWFPHAWSGEEEDFSEGMARIKVDAGRSPLTTFTKYLNGFIDAKGDVRIPPQYEEAEDFSEGLAAVQVSTWQEGYNTTKDRYGYIDRSGAVVIKPRFNSADSFHEGLAEIEVKGGGGRITCGYIDAAGRMVIKPRFNFAQRFSGGIAMVKPSFHTMAYIDKTGRYVWGPSR